MASGLLFALVSFALLLQIEAGMNVFVETNALVATK